MNDRPTHDPRRNADGYYLPADEKPTEVAVLVGVHLIAQRPGVEPVFADLDELERLADTAGATIAGRMEQRRQSPDVRSLIGKGKAEQLKSMVESLGANLVVFDNDLTPAQGRNLERQLNVNIIDRTELILDIFARHARTQQARLQVGLAQYEYMLPRLARMWKHLERQAGGIGTRGPGETQIETDRRLIRNRITHLKRELRHLDQRMRTQHKQRQSEMRVALVGYTNAGKSSLMNSVCQAGVYVQDQLFATLDATTRKVETGEGNDFLLTDTVGFIRKLPHHLVESFRATLSEVAEADILLHIVDAGDEDVDGRIEAVNEVLASVAREEGTEQSVRLVFNKLDTIDEQGRVQLERAHPGAAFTSAHTGEGIEELLAWVGGRIRKEERELLVQLPNGDGRGLAALHELGEVYEVEYENDLARVRLRVGPVSYGRVMSIEGIEVLEVAGRR